MARKPELWSGRLGFVLANVASAVGLGSIWKFPYEVGTNGGSAFVFFYLIGVGLIVLPLMLAELVIGRRGRSDAIRSIITVARNAGASPKWSYFGLLGIITGFLILSFYSVIGGWALAYLVDAIRVGLPGVDTSTVQERFDALLRSPFQLGLYHFIFMTMTALIVARGIAGGIEHASTILMPSLAFLVAALAVYSAIQGDLAATLRFFFSFDMAHMKPEVALEALGLGFFSIGVGLCTMITYAAYAGSEINLKQVAIFIVVSDTTISLLAGFSVFPVVFAENLDPASGPGLVFITLPVAFARMPFGTLAAAAFFTLLAVAAIGSAISLLELAVAPIRNAFGWSQARATVVCASVCWIVGLATVLSFNHWAAWFPLAVIPKFATSTMFDLIDYLTSNLLLPFGGLGIAIFIGWATPQQVLAQELELSAGAAKLLRVLLRYFVPILIGAATVGPFF